MWSGIPYDEVEPSNITTAAKYGVGYIRNPNKINEMRPGKPQISGEFNNMAGYKESTPFKMSMIGYSTDCNCNGPTCECSGDYHSTPGDVRGHYDHKMHNKLQNKNFKKLNGNNNYSKKNKFFNNKNMQNFKGKKNTYNSTPFRPEMLHGNKSSLFKSNGSYMNYDRPYADLEDKSAQLMHSQYNVTTNQHTRKGFNRPEVVFGYPPQAPFRRTIDMTQMVNKCHDNPACVKKNKYESKYHQWRRMNYQSLNDRQLQYGWYDKINPWNPNFYVGDENFNNEHIW